ncbi:MAG: MerR family transcriptional regulator [Gammaproteobacteria bacterium]|nr:MAG: MerR family transcriptional regulator [Gammaproteobacteria bacterium]
MNRDRSVQITGELLDDQVELTMGEICRTCHLSAEQLIEMVEFGVIEPVKRSHEQWIFHGSQLYRIKRFIRLKHDLGINDAGAALVIELLDELTHLRQQLQRIRTAEDQD